MAPSGRGTHRGVGVATLGMADVDLVLRGLLVHRVVEVDAVDALQSPVPPEEEGPEAQKCEQHCGWDGGQRHALPCARPVPCDTAFKPPTFSFVNCFVLIYINTCPL